VLAITASIFDPLGLLSPAVIVYKIFLQKLWQDKLQCDELLPAHLQQSWNQLHRTSTTFTNQNKQEGDLLHCHQHSTTWILRQVIEPI